jgi:hypothetical protein
MNTPENNKMNHEKALFIDGQKIQIRTFDPVLAEKELRLRLADIKTVLECLDEAKLVTQETLQLEFSI